MLKKILIGIAVVVVVFLVIVALQPAQYIVARSGTISAPPAEVFARIDDLHKFQDWSPWGKLDPAMKITYEGAPAGNGASYSWAGNSKVGEGRMTITESRPSELVRMKLEFIKPFASTATTEFALKVEGKDTAIIWSMTGEKNFMSKAFCLFVSMDKMVGGDFERGLANLKSVTEAAARK